MLLSEIVGRHSVAALVDLIGLVDNLDCLLEGRHTSAAPTN